LISILQSVSWTAAGFETNPRGEISEEKMKKTIAAFLRPGSQWNPEKPVREQAYWEEHARFMDSLFEAGTILLGGPFADGSGSMVILEGESVEAAQAIFQDDPWAQQDVLVASEVKEWTIFLDAREKAQR
jgi:uncharacterized protein